MDPTFYRNAAEAVTAPVEELAFVVAYDPDGKKNDALFVVDLKSNSPTWGRVVGKVEVPPGQELHHFGWNACSSAFKHEGHPMEGLERRYLIVPGLRSSNIFIIDTKPDPRNPKIAKVIPMKELSDKAGYTRPHTIHCGPGGIFMTCLGGPEGDADGQTGIALLDHQTFNVVGAWETDHGPQRHSYDAWWHMNKNTLISSEWAPPSLIENGLDVEALVQHKYGKSLHFWNLDQGKHVQAINLEEGEQMVLEVRPTHNPDATWGFVGVTLSTKDLSGSIYLWSCDDDGQWKADKVINIPAEPVDDPNKLPPILRPFGAVPPLITDIDLSVDDKFLYISCWGTGELRQYDVRDPSHPILTGSVRLGGVANHTPHPSQPDKPCPGSVQMVEVSRDGRHAYFTPSLYSAWDDQFYPDGVGNWMAKVNINPEGGMELDPDFFPQGEEFNGLRVHQIRLQGGDASTDSYCWPSPAVPARL
ncbi:Methanethiol oxidase [Knufia peltigerae]|uniref:Methanethiol oxidase n=1 Tax=Knufia peltigerae TaxID=1002370 RepID=A0AA39D022_9EURO|nr:Methanethiol oxidase [Knufia peltigerae]